MGGWYYFSGFKHLHRSFNYHKSFVFFSFHSNYLYTSKIIKPTRPVMGEWAYRFSQYKYYCFCVTILYSKHSGGFIKKIFFNRFCHKRDLQSRWSKSIYLANMLTLSNLMPSQGVHWTCELLRCNLKPSNKHFTEYGSNKVFGSSMLLFQ